MSDVVSSLTALLPIVGLALMPVSMVSFLMAVSTGGWTVLGYKRFNWVWLPNWFQQTPDDLDPVTWRHMRRGALCFFAGWSLMAIAAVLHSAFQTS